MNDDADISQSYDDLDKMSQDYNDIDQTSEYDDKENVGELTIHHLPEDVLQHIISHIFRFSDVVNLMRTCTSFERLVRTHLRKIYMGINARIPVKYISRFVRLRKVHLSTIDIDHPEDVKLLPYNLINANFFVVGKDTLAILIKKFFKRSIIHALVEGEHLSVNIYKGKAYNHCPFHLHQFISDLEIEHVRPYTQAYQEILEEHGRIYDNGLVGIIWNGREIPCDLTIRTVDKFLAQLLNISSGYHCGVNVDLALLRFRRNHLIEYNNNGNNNNNNNNPHYDLDISRKVERRLYCSAGITRVELSLAKFYIQDFTVDYMIADLPELFEKERELFISLINERYAYELTVLAIFRSNWVPHQGNG